MQGEFKIERYSQMAKEIGYLLTEKYGCRINLAETPWLNFCAYVTAEGKYDNVVNAMIEASALSEDEPPSETEKIKTHKK